MINLILSNVFDYQAFLDSVFEKFLVEQHISAITRKNYRSDLRNFFSWIIKTIQNIDNKIPESIDKLVTRISTEQLEEYKHELLLEKTPQATINRRLSSLRMLFRFAQENRWINHNPMSLVKNIVTSNAKEKNKQNLLQDFSKSLVDEGAAATTIKTYVSDVSDFLDWQTS